jgi:hypothetical protein
VNQDFVVVRVARQENGHAAGTTCIEPEPVVRTFTGAVKITTSHSTSHRTNNILFFLALGIENEKNTRLKNPKENNGDLKNEEIWETQNKNPRHWKSTVICESCALMFFHNNKQSTSIIHPILVKHLVSLSVF